MVSITSRHDLRLTTARQRAWPVGNDPAGTGALGQGPRLKATMDIAIRAAAGPVSAVWCTVRFGILKGSCLTGDDGHKLAHTVDMRDASGHSPHPENQGFWQPQVQLSRGHWRREDAAGAVRSAGWWESVTVTWSPAPAAERRPGVLLRALAAAADMAAPVLADAAAAGTRRLLDRRRRVHPVASSLQRQLASVVRELPGPDRTR
jgi:hypothetical protein